MSDHVVSPRRAETRARLFDAAVTVFASRGIGSTSVEQLCEAAGFTRGAFYSNFHDMDELAYELFAMLHERMLNAVREAVERVDGSGSESLEDALSLAVETFLDVTGSSDLDHVITLLELRVHALRNPRLRKVLHDRESQLEPMFVELFSVTAERFGARFIIPPEQVNFLLDALLLKATIQSGMQGREGSDRQIVKRALLTTLDQIVVPRG